MNAQTGPGTRHDATPRRVLILKSLVAAAVLLTVMALVAAGCSRKDAASKDKDRPMAGMAGEAEKTGAAGDIPETGAAQAVQKAVTEEKASGKQLYICPMHPTYVSDHPGDCPICGMRLVPAEQMSAGEEGAGVPGMAAIRLGAEGIRLAGVRTATAEEGSVARTIRTVGIISADDSRVRRVQVKAEGYVERLFVNTPGQAVRKGDPLLAIYSPDLLAGQEEYVRAIEARKNLGGGAGAPGRASAGGTPAAAVTDRSRDADLLVSAARERLHLLDVPDDVLEQLEQTGQPTRTITLRSPVSGVVTERTAYEGMKVMPGMELFTITDLSEVWIEGSFYESEAPLLAVGRQVTVTLAYDPSVTLQGEVKFVYPYLDPESRTLRARFSFPNADGALKPGMYANVMLEADGGSGVTIPDNAVMDTGERKIVFVSRGDGLFEPRQVETGLRSEGMVQVLSGVMAGEEVVVRANFLLDSESRIRAALGGNGAAAAADSGRAAPGAPSSKAPESMPGMPGMSGGK
jgi:membrane fusion protein, copper/silver efflux system